MDKAFNLIEETKQIFISTANRMLAAGNVSPLITAYNWLCDEKLGDREKVFNIADKYKFLAYLKKADDGIFDQLISCRFNGENYVWFDGDEDTLIPVDFVVLIDLKPTSMLYLMVSYRAKLGGSSKICVMSILTIKHTQI